MSSEDELRAALPTHVGGMLIAAAGLLDKLDRPGMSIELLRECKEVDLFRQSKESFCAWWLAAAASAPDSVLPREERRFLVHWFAEREGVIARASADSKNQTQK